MSTIQHLGYDNQPWVLVDSNTDEPVVRGSVREADDEEVYILGGSPPHKSSSTGRVLIEYDSGGQQEYFPSVFGLRWRHVAG